MSTPLLVKMLTLARADATLQGYLLGSNGTFRWFPLQLPKGYIQQGTCVTLRQISTVSHYVQEGPLSLEEVMMQIDIRDFDQMTAQALASYLNNSWFPSVSFLSDAQFLSPPGVPPNFPNFQLSQRSGLDYEIQPQSPWVETLTYRIFNNTNT